MIFIVDFDGTVSVRDTVDALLEKFADPLWQSIEQDWIDGKIGSRACMRAQLRLVTAERQAVEDFLGAAEIDPGFVAFVRTAAPLGQIAIVSDGLDYPIETVMRKIGMTSIPTFANKLHFQRNGLDISFPYANDACAPQSGVCKCAVARAFGDTPIVLIGDGRSDRCLAKTADYVFAKGSLQEFCRDQNIRYTPFTSFNDITALMQQWHIDRFVVRQGKRYAT